MFDHPTTVSEITDPATFLVALLPQINAAVEPYRKRATADGLLPEIHELIDDLCEVATDEAKQIENRDWYDAELLLRFCEFDYRIALDRWVSHLSWLDVNPFDYYAAHYMDSGMPDDLDEISSSTSLNEVVEHAALLHRASIGREIFDEIMNELCAVFDEACDYAMTCYTIIDEASDLSNV